MGLSASGINISCSKWAFLVHLFKQVYMFTCVCPCGRCHCKCVFNNWTVCVFSFCLRVCATTACAQTAGQFLKAVVRASLIRAGATHTRSLSRTCTGTLTWPPSPFTLCLTSSLTCSFFTRFSFLLSSFFLFESSTICLSIFPSQFHLFLCISPLSLLCHPLLSLCLLYCV